MKLEKGDKRSDWSPAPEDVVSGFVNRNVLKNSSTFDLVNSDYPARTERTFNNSTNIGKISVLETNHINAHKWSGSNIVLNDDFYKKVGEKYTISVDVKGSGTGDYNFYISSRAQNNADRNDSTWVKIPMNNEWTRISADFEVKNNNAERTLFIIGGSGVKGDTIEYRNIKVEKGPATAHSLAPEDAEKSATHTVTQNGTYTFLATDNVGNMSEKSIKVSNIDKEDPVFNKDEDFKVEARYVEGENNYWISANDTAELRLKGT